MDKLQAMSVFVKIAEHGSLTKAADCLGKSLPSVVRILARFEEDLQVRLFNRTTRKIVLTEEGYMHLENCRKILADIEGAEEMLINDRAEPRGLITLTAPVCFGEMYVNPAIIKFLKQYPEIRINLLLLDRVANILDEEINLAIRIAHINDSTMTAKPLGKIRQVICASPQVIEKYGIPKQPAELSELPCILFTGLSKGENWIFQDKGKPKLVQTNGIFHCNEAKTSVNSCVNGLGFGMFLSYQVMPWVKSGDLIIVLEKFEPVPTPVNLVFYKSRMMPTRVRLLVDFLMNELRSSF